MHDGKFCKGSLFSPNDVSYLLGAEIEFSSQWMNTLIEQSTLMQYCSANSVTHTISLNLMLWIFGFTFRSIDTNHSMKTALLRVAMGNRTS